MTLNLTDDCMMQLMNTIESSEKLAYRDNTHFSNYIESNSQSFVSNHERAFRYLYKMILRYQNQKRNKKQSDKGVDIFRPFEKREESQISLSNFIKRFSVFMDYYNIYSASERFLMEYISFDEDEFGYEEDIDTFRERVLPDSNNETEVRAIFYDRVRIALSLNCENYDYSKHKSSSELSKNEKKQIKRIIKKGPKVTNDDINSFKGILSGEKDVSRMLFIMLYLFTSYTEVDDRANNASARINELNNWLLRSGFIPLSEAFKEFVITFYQSIFTIFDAEALPDEDDPESFTYEHHQIEEEQSYYFNDVFSYIFDQDLTVDIADVHLQCVSVMDEELSILPVREEQND